LIEIEIIQELVDSFVRLTIAVVVEPIASLFGARES
jgi:hypothetical protein